MVNNEIIQLLLVYDILTDIHYLLNFPLYFYTDILNFLENFLELIIKIASNNYLDLFITGNSNMTFTFSPLSVLEWGVV